MLANELTISGQYAAEVPGPGAIERAVQNDAPDTAGPKLVGLGWKAEIGVDLAVGEQPHLLGGGVRHPGYIPARIEADVSDDGSGERVLAGSNRLNGHRLPFEIPDRSDAVGREQLETARVDAGQENDRVTGIDPDGERRDEPHGEVDLAGGQRLVEARGGDGDVLHVGEALADE